MKTLAKLCHYLVLPRITICWCILWLLIKIWISRAEKNFALKSKVPKMNKRRQCSHISTKMSRKGSRRRETILFTSRPWVTLLIRRIQVLKTSQIKRVDLIVNSYNPIPMVTLTKSIGLLLITPIYWTKIMSHITAPLVPYQSLRLLTWAWNQEQE